jgi:hypothetical protein
MKYIALLLAPLLFSSCATIFNRSKPTTITTNPTGAKIEIMDKNAVVVHQGVSPMSVSLKASNGYFKAASYNVRVSKKGFPTRNVELRSDLSGWYFGNILLGGVIGMLIVDPATGAMWKMPADYSVNLQALASVNSDNGSSLAIVDYTTLTHEQKNKLVRI